MYCSASPRVINTILPHVIVAPIEIYADGQKSEGPGCNANSDKDAQRKTDKLKNFTHTHGLPCCKNLSPHIHQSGMDCQ